MGGRTLGHLGPSGGRRGPFGGRPILRNIFSGPGTTVTTPRTFIDQNVYLLD